MLQIGNAADVQIVAAVVAQANDGMLGKAADNSAIAPNQGNKRRSLRCGFGPWGIHG